MKNWWDDDDVDRWDDKDDVGETKCDKMTIVMVTVVEEKEDIDEIVLVVVLIIRWHWSNVVTLVQRTMPGTAFGVTAVLISIDIDGGLAFTEPRFESVALSVTAGNTHLFFWCFL